MKFEILARPAAAIAKVDFSPGETLTCEVGAMIAMTTQFTVSTTTTPKGGGGIFRTIKRMVGGENLFLNHFTAQSVNQRLLLGPGMPGDIVHHRLRGGLIVQGGSWLASTPGITIDGTWQGLLKGVFGGEGLFWLKLTGNGDVLLDSFGAVRAIPVAGEYIVDTGHIVAFEETLSFRLAKAGQTLLGSYLGGEGLVCRFSGHGLLYCQSHNPPSFGRMLGPKLKPR